MSAPWHDGHGMLRMGPVSRQGFGRDGRGGLPATSHGAPESGRGKGGQMRDLVGGLRRYFGNAKNGTDKRLDDLESGGGGGGVYESGREHYQTEMYDYPSAFEFGWGDGTGAFNDNGHLAKVLMAKITASMAVPITIMAPVSRHDGSLTLEFSMINFTTHIMDKVPEQSVPRTLTMRKTKGHASMERYAISMILEVTFMETPMGQFTYNANFEQMRLAWLETMIMKATFAVVNSVPDKDPFPIGQDFSSRELSLDDVTQILNEEASWFAIAQKSPNGLQSARNRLKKTLAERERDYPANFELLCQGMEEYLSSGDRGSYISGTGTAEQIRAHQSRGHTIWTSRHFSLGHDLPMVDPMFSWRSIGNYVTMHDTHLRSVPIEQYRTALMDVITINRAKDCFERVSFAENFLKTGVWDFRHEDAPVTRGLEDSELGPGIGASFVRDVRCFTYRQLYEISCQEGIDRAVAAMQRLSPQRQSELLASAFLLPQGDLRVSYSPTSERDADNWSDEAFFGMSKQVQASDHGRLRGVNDLAEDEFGTVGLSLTSSLEDLGLGGGGGGGGNSSKFKRKRGDAGGRAPEDATPVPESRAMPDSNLASTLAAQLRASQPLKQLHAPLKVNHLLVDHVATNGHFTSAEQVTILSEIKRVLAILGADEGRFAQLSPEDRVRVRAAFFAHMARFVAPFEAQVVLRSVPRNVQTGLEVQAQRSSMSEAAAMNNMLADQGRFKVDGTDEDGQIALAAAHLPPTDASLLMDNDSYAATYAANHTALFAFPSVGDYKKVLPNLADPEKLNMGIKRGRTNAQVFSFVASVVYQSLLEHMVKKPKDKPDEALAALAKDLLKAPAPAGPAAKAFEGLLARLKDVAGQVALLGTSVEALRARVLPSQYSMLHTVIAIHVALHNQVRDAGDKIALDAAFYDNVAAELAVARRQEATKEAAKALVQPHFVSPVASEEERERMQDDAQPGAGAQAAAVAGAASAGGWTAAFCEDILTRASLISGRLARFFLRHDIPVPIGVRNTGPECQFEMGSLLVMHAGAVDGAARTLTQMPHCMVAANAAQKVFIGHFSVYFTTVVPYPRRIATMHNVYCKGMGPGNDLSLNDPCDEADVDTWQNDDRAYKSRFALPILHIDAERWPTTWMSITGEIPDSLPASQAAKDAIHYPGASGVALHWGFKTHARSTYGRYSYQRNDYLTDGASAPHQNVICFQGHEQHLLPDHMPALPAVPAAGHLDARTVYAGASGVLRGSETYFGIPSHLGLNQMEVRRMR